MASTADAPRSLTASCEKLGKLGKIGARLVCHRRHMVFQLAEVAVPRALFAAILRRINWLRGPPAPAM